MKILKKIKSVDWSTIGFYTFIIIVVVVVGSLMVKLYNTGTNASDYKTICMEDGHEYYYANFMAKIALALKVDDNGKPIRCKE